MAEGDRKRQEFSFTLYDFDGHGKITKDDIAGLVTTIYDTLGASIDPSTSVRQQDDQGETDGVAGSEEQPDTGRVSERLLAACGDELFRKFVLLPLEARVVQQCRDPRRRARFTQSS